MINQEFIQEKIGFPRRIWIWTLPENIGLWKSATSNGHFTKIGDLKTNLSQKIRDLKTDPKTKNYIVILHTCSVTNEFTRKLFKNFTKLYFFTREKKKKKLLHFFLFLNKIIREVHKNRTLKKKKILDEPL